MSKSKPGRKLYGPKVGVGRPKIRIFAKKQNSNSDSHPYGDDWPRISAEVKKRDNYTCQAHRIGLPKCKNRFPPPLHACLHAHHIDRFRRSKNNDKRNLVTLCIACHNKEHGRHVGYEATEAQKRFARSL